MSVRTVYALVLSRLVLSRLVLSSLVLSCFCIVSKEHVVLFPSESTMFVLAYTRVGHEPIFVYSFLSRVHGARNDLRLSFQNGTSEEFDVSLISFVVWCRLCFGMRQGVKDDTLHILSQ